jgi:hypothetical protein
MAAWRIVGSTTHVSPVPAEGAVARLLDCHRPCRARENFEMIDLGRGDIAWTAEDRETLLNEALASDSKSRSAVSVYFTGSYPQWRGSFKLMESFIDDTKRHVGDPAGHR